MASHYKPTLYGNIARIMIGHFAVLLVPVDDFYKRFFAPESRRSNCKPQCHTLLRCHGAAPAFTTERSSRNRAGWRKSQFEALLLMVVLLTMSEAENTGDWCCSTEPHVNERSVWILVDVCKSTISWCFCGNTGMASKYPLVTRGYIFLLPPVW